MNTDNAWSPDEPLGTEVFEQGDEALDEKEGVDPSFSEAVQQDPSLDPTNVIDELELKEAGANLDDPETMLTLPGGGDDPDGLGGPPESDAGQHDKEGWDVDRSESAHEEAAPN